MTSAHFTLSCCCHKHTLAAYNLLRADPGDAGRCTQVEAAGTRVTGVVVAPCDHDAQAHLENLADQLGACGEKTIHVTLFGTEEA